MERYKVVIIDDEPWTRDVIKSLVPWETLALEVAGEASDGEYGLELIEQLQPDIILTDVHMPHISGIDLVSHLRKKGNNAKVIIISGYDDFVYIRSALKLDVADYLLKPIKPEELNDQLQRCITLLNEENREKAETGEYIDGFLNAPWTDEYFALRSSAYECLFSADAPMIRQKFKQIRQLIENHEKENISRGAIIGIYYGLIGWLQRFISSSGYSPSEVFENQNTSFVFSRGCTLGDMLDFACELYCRASQSVQELIKARNRLDIHLVKTFIQENFATGITLKETATRFFVSKEYLSKLFKESTGEGFSEYVTALRMNKAKNLITEYKVPLKEVGAMVGYLDQAHFYKAFKRFFRKTPGEMQRD